MYFDNSPKWYLCGIYLSMALMGICFEEVYNKTIGVVMNYEFVLGIRT
jgi:hypothetical protein